jgi:azurin
MMSSAGQTFLKILKRQEPKPGSSTEKTPVSSDATVDPETTVVRIKTVPLQMRYDTTTFSVPAGKTVMLILDNPDHMPHNLVITKVGTMEKVGLLADRMILDPEAAKKHYVPETPMVLFATKLIFGQASTILQFTAPSVPGDYPYICTFPGHWRLMKGVMKVVPAEPEKENLVGVP